MDARQFDTIVKELARIHVSRLAALRGLAAVALAGVTTASFTDLDSTAKRRNKHKGKQHRKDKRKTRQTTRQAFGRIGKPCNKDKPCGMYTECQFGRCSPTKCRIDGNLIDSGIRNDDNRCEYCSPNLAGDLWQQWKTFPDGTACPTDREDNPCLSTFIATCRGGECIPDRLADGQTCGDDRVCCTGNCCEPGACCGAGGTCFPCGTGCTIEDVSYAPGTEKTPGGCLICDPGQNETDWSLRADGESCGEAAGRTCCNGVCCAPTECCVGLTCEACDCEDGGERRRNRRGAAAAADDCGPVCEIGGQSYPDGASNPENPCEVCDAAQDPAGWSVAPFLTKCGQHLDRICCAGVCCSDDTCCRPGYSSCSIEWCGIVNPCPHIDGPCGCTIDGRFYAHQAVNPVNVCEWCDAYWSTTSWTARPSYHRCGPSADRYCCEGTCCETGACCNATKTCEVSAPGCVGCTIAGRFYHDGSKNPADPCQKCLVDESTTTWSAAPNGIVCEVVVENGVFYGNRVCCEGSCCPLHECCSFSGICQATASSNCQ